MHNTINTTGRHFNPKIKRTFCALFSHQRVDAFPVSVNPVRHAVAMAGHTVSSAEKGTEGLGTSGIKRRMG